MAKQLVVTSDPVYVHKPSFIDPARLSVEGKTLLALEEKKVSYKETIVSLVNGEQNEAWYLRINPNGQVPLLKLGDKYIPESEDIIDTVDKLNNAPVLVPDSSTAEGNLVKEWRFKLHNIDVEGLTFGIMLNPELAEGETHIIPQYRQTKEEYLAKNEKLIEKLEAMKVKYPDLQEALEKKIAKRKENQTKFEKSLVIAIKEQLEGVFDGLENQLRKSRTENIIEHWLCGPKFTVADVCLCVLLGRLVYLGLADRYLNHKTRPALVEYWNQAKQRPSVIKVVLGAKKRVMMYLAKKTATKVAAGAAVAGGVVALGVLIGHKLKS